MATKYFCDLDKVEIESSDLGSVTITFTGGESKDFDLCKDCRTKYKPAELVAALSKVQVDYNEKKDFNYVEKVEVKL